MARATYHLFHAGIGKIIPWPHGPLTMISPAEPIDGSYLATRLLPLVRVSIHDWFGPSLAPPLYILVHFRRKVHVHSASELIGICNETSRLNNVRTRRRRR